MYAITHNLFFKRNPVLITELKRVPEIVLYIHYNKLVKVPLMLVHYRKILHTSVVSRQI